MSSLNNSTAQGLISALSQQDYFVPSGGNIVKVTCRRRFKSEGGKDHGTLLVHFDAYHQATPDPTNDRKSIHTLWTLAKDAKYPYTKKYRVDVGDIISLDSHGWNTIVSSEPYSHEERPRFIKFVARRDHSRLEGRLTTRRVSMKTFERFIVAVQQQDYFDPDEGSITSIEHTRRFEDVNGELIAVKNCCFPAFRQKMLPRKGNSPKKRRDIFWALADDLMFGLDGKWFVLEEGDTLSSDDGYCEEVTFSHLYRYPKRTHTEDREINNTRFVKIVTKPFVPF